jgi:hypothetical protein
MLDKRVDVPARQDEVRRPAPDFQAHIADLEARGLLVRVDCPINKDTELHPLVRWQFLGGITENARRAFLFTNVIDAKGRALRYSRGGRRAGGVAGYLCRRHGREGRGHRRGMDCAAYDPPVPEFTMNLAPSACYASDIAADRRAGN